jgi:hypothetical protein
MNILSQLSHSGLLNELVKNKSIHHILGNMIHKTSKILSNQKFGKGNTKIKPHHKDVLNKILKYDKPVHIDELIKNKHKINMISKALDNHLQQIGSGFFDNIASKLKNLSKKASHELKRFVDGKTKLKPSKLLNYISGGVATVGALSAVIPGVDLISVPTASAISLGLHGLSKIAETSGRGCEADRKALTFGMGKLPKKIKSYIDDKPHEVIQVLEEMNGGRWNIQYGSPQQLFHGTGKKQIMEILGRLGICVVSALPIYNYLKKHPEKTKTLLKQAAKLGLTKILGKGDFKPSKNYDGSGLKENLIKLNKLKIPNKIKKFMSKYPEQSMKAIKIAYNFAKKNKKLTLSALSIILSLIGGKILGDYLLSLQENDTSALMELANNAFNSSTRKFNWMSMPYIEGNGLQTMGKGLQTMGKGLHPVGKKMPKKYITFMKKYPQASKKLASMAKSETQIGNGTKLKHFLASLGLITTTAALTGSAFYTYLLHNPSAAAKIVIQGVDNTIMGYGKKGGNLEATTGYGKKKKIKKIGNREDVYYGRCIKTGGGLRKEDLILKGNRIISRRKSELGKKIYQKHKFKKAS